MKRQIPFTGGAILGAGGLGYWLSGSAVVTSVLLGASSACGCIARLSDFSDRWANCAIANAAIDGKLQVLFEGTGGWMREEVPLPQRQMSSEQSRLLTDQINPSCGSFSDARRADLALKAERRKASFEDLFVPGSFEDALMYSDTGAGYLDKKEIENLKNMQRRTKGA